jgi:hypothetical protein
LEGERGDLGEVVKSGARIGEGRRGGEGNFFKRVTLPNPKETIKLI